MLKEKTNLTKYLILIISLIVLLLVLTGCGASSKIVDTLNNVVNEEFAEWQEQGYARSFTMYLIQEELNKVKPEYVIVASGDTWKYGISKEETMVFGDNINDLEMLERAKYSFAIGNAREEVKEKANYIADTNVNHGVLKVLRQVLESL